MVVSWLALLSKYTDFSEVHDEKHELPIVTTVEGIVTVVSPEDLNAELAKLVKLAPLKFSVLSAVQPENALLSTVVQSLGIVTLPSASGVI